jgi:hypothetical protein
MPGRCKQWVVNCKTANLDQKTPAQLRANCVVCGEHFEDRMFMNASVRNKLVHNAVPTLFTFPASSSSVLISAGKRKAPTDRSTVVVVKRTKKCTQKPEERSSNQPEPTEPSYAADPTPIPTVKTSEILTPRKQQLTKKLEYAQAGLARARVALFRYRKASQAKSQSAVRKNASPGSYRCSCSLCSDINSLPASQREFIECQLKSCKFAKFGMRYTQKDKLLALGLYYKSPSAYRFMSGSFRLPSERTLQTFIGGFNTRCGFKSDYLHALQKRTEAMQAMEKYCVLTFDGMSLKTKLQYSEQQDKVLGFVDLDDFGDSLMVTAEGAKQALQFMVRGVSTRWKQPLGHFFGSHSVKSDILKQMLKCAVSLLEGIGLTVVAVVCDQEASHRVLHSALGATVDEPWFKSDTGSKVFMMFDVPHLIKNVRNNIMKYDFLTQDHTVSFSYVRKMYEREKSSCLRLCPKLTDGHFDLQPFKKMKVALATQVMSHSVAAAIRTYVNFNQLDQAALPTADFIEKIDKIFDVLNSRTQSAKHKWKKPLTSTSNDQFELLDEAVDWIKSWKFRHVNTKKEITSLPFHQGLLQTIRAIRQVSHQLLTEHGFRFVLTSRFNQDIVENWFSCIRQKGLNNDSRTAWEYESAGKASSV